MELQWIQWVANFGFAAVVAFYLLVRMERVVQGLGRTLRINTVVLARATGQDYDQVCRDFENGGSNGGGTR